jgi:hypothetical protein
MIDPLPQGKGEDHPGHQQRLDQGERSRVQRQRVKAEADEIGHRADQPTGVPDRVQREATQVPSLQRAQMRDLGGAAMLQCTRHREQCCRNQRGNRRDEHGRSRS